MLGSTKGRILREIAKDSIHGYGLASKLKISLSSVYGHLGDLKKSGFIEARRKGRKNVYVLTDKGRYLLKALE